MPNKPVTVRRWEVVGAFLLLVAVAVLIALWNDYRIDQAEERILRNQQENVQQNRIRAILLEGLREADRRSCLRIEALKTQRREDAQRDFGRLEEIARVTGIPLTEELRRVARAELARDLRRNRPSEC